MSSFVASHLLLVEGIPTSGKSTLIDALVREHVNSAPVRTIRTLVSLTQDHTGGPLNPAEDSGTLTREDTIAHLHAVVEHVSWFVEAAARGGMPQPFIVLDTLHLTNCVRRGPEWEDVRTLDADLARLGGKLLLLKTSPQTAWTRMFDGRPERAAFSEGYARRFGKTPEEIHRYFMHEQVRMENLYEMSSLQKRVIDADQPLANYLGMVRDFWYLD
jgi:thymidylate kinase